MDFFGHQDQARRNTSILIGMFIAAVVMIILSVYVAVVGGLFVAQLFVGNQFANSLAPEHFWDIKLFLTVTGVTTLVVAGGSIYKMVQLSNGGGAAVAEMLGGVRLASGKADPLHRRLLNVVEEMAIACGLPVPPVYLLDQDGVNAFAAGFTPSDTVIGITRGAVELLSRDELQGVVAHEFSHILNGDTRMKMRLLGLLHGITLVSDIGIQMMTMRRVNRYSSRNQGGMHPALLVIGFSIFMVGTVGLVFADMIKRAVSRQREFLADASAVQFTRNPLGIAGALKVIGGYKAGSRVNHMAAQQASHLFFGNAIKSFMQTDWWATHPPLIERIRRIEPGFQGKFKKIMAASRMLDNSAAALSAFGPADASAPKAEQLVSSVDAVMEQIGKPNAAHLEYAEKLIAEIPDRLRDFVHEPYTARAVIYALLLDADTEPRKVQLQVLQKSADPNVFREMLEIQPLMKKMRPELRLPLVDMVIPALKELSPQQGDAFRKNLVALIKANHQVSIFEYVMHRILLMALQGEHASPDQGEVSFRSADALRDDVACILAQVAAVGTHRKPAAAFKAGMAMFTEQKVAMPEPAQCRLSHFDAAMKKARHASPDLKRQMLKACIFCIMHNHHVSVDELELLRAIAAMLDCPMPPLFAG